MSNKTIKIQEILVDKSLLEWAPFCLVTGLHEHSGYYVVAANNQVFVEKSWWDNEDETETLALVNDHDLNREAKREATVSFDVDTVEEKDIPVFGVTIDGNYNIQQFNLTVEEIADDAALDSLLIANRNQSTGISTRTCMSGRTNTRKSSSRNISTL